MAGKKELFEEMYEELENLVIDDRNKELVEFFTRNLPLLLKCPVTEVDYTLIFLIAVWIDEAKQSDHDWFAYAIDMGIRNNDDLARISVSKGQPIFSAMFHQLKQNCGTFGHIIWSLLKNKRYDVLGKIKPRFGEILKNNPQVNPQLLKDEATTANFSPNNLDGSNSDECSTVDLNCAPEEDDKKAEFNSLQHSISVSSGSAQQINHYPSSSQSASEGNKNPSSKEGKMPTAPAKEIISIFIQHTEHDQDIARELSEKLKEEGMTVITLSDLDPVLQFDPTGSLVNFFLGADFIVPIVSNSMLRQLYPLDDKAYLESTYAQNNKNLHQLIMTEYRNNRCVNHRVRPVIVPEMEKQQLVKDVIFSTSYRLWNEVPKLVEILKQTKKLNAERLAH